MIVTVGKNSAFIQQSQFDPRLQQGLNICETVFSAKVSSAFHPYKSANSLPVSSES